MMTVLGDAADVTHMNSLELGTINSEHYTATHTILKQLLSTVQKLKKETLL